MAFDDSYYWNNGSGPYCGVFGHDFIRRLCTRWNHSRLYTDLPFSGEAHGTDNLTAHRLLQLLRDSHLAKFDIVFVQIGENDLTDITVHHLMFKLVSIVEEFRRQGVRRVVFGCMFQRHNRPYNKRAKQLNKILRKIPKTKQHLWDHDPDLINNDVISSKDGVHLWRSAESLFASSIADALRYSANY